MKIMHEHQGLDGLNDRLKLNNAYEGWDYYLRSNRIKLWEELTRPEAIELEKDVIQRK